MNRNSVTASTLHLTAKHAVREKPNAADGFDFVALESHVATKAPRYTGKKWRVASPGNNKDQAPSFTRKQYGGLKNFFTGKRSSTAWNEKARDQAWIMQFELGGAKLLNACLSLDKGKVKDTKEFHAHLKVLACAQKKWQAKLLLNQAESSVKEASTPVLKLKQTMQAEQNVRSQAVKNQLAAMRQKALGRQKAGADTPEGVSDRQVAKVLELEARQPEAPVVPTASQQQVAPPEVTAKNKRGVLTKAKRAVIPLIKPGKKTHGKKHSSQASAQTAAPQKKNGVNNASTVVSPARLFEVLESKTQPGETTQELIEHLLIDRDVGAYLAPAVFEAMLALYADLQRKAVESYTADYWAPHQPLLDRLTQSLEQYDDALAVFDKLPDPELVPSA